MATSHESRPNIKHFGAAPPRNPLPLLVTKGRPSLQEHVANFPPSRSQPECRRHGQQRFLHCLEEIKEAEATRAALASRTSFEAVRESSAPSNERPLRAGTAGEAVAWSDAVWSGDASPELSLRRSPVLQGAAGGSPAARERGSPSSAQPSPPPHHGYPPQVTFEEGQIYGGYSHHHEASSPCARSAASPSGSSEKSPRGGAAPFDFRESARPPPPLAPTISLPTYASYTASLPSYPSYTASMPSSSACPAAFPATHTSPSSSATTFGAPAASYHTSFPSSSSQPSYSSASSAADSEDVASPLADTSPSAQGTASACHYHVGRYESTSAESAQKSAVPSGSPHRTPFPPSAGAESDALGPSACPYQAGLFPSYAPLNAAARTSAQQEPSAPDGGGERGGSSGSVSEGGRGSGCVSDGGCGDGGGGDGGGGANGARICSRELLSTIINAHDIFARDMTPNGGQVCDYLLSQLLHLTRSSAGCISSALTRPARDGSSSSNSGNSGNGDNSRLYLKTHSITNFSWTPYLKAWYAENAASGLVFSNMRTLMGQVAVSADVVISADVATDPRLAGVPDGHPPMTTFLGVPLFSGSRLIGMFAVTNREGGYSESMVTELHALTKTVGQIVEGIQQRRQRWEREERLNAVLEGASQAVLSVTSAGCLSSINRAARRVFGLPESAATNAGAEETGTGAGGAAGGGAGAAAGAAARAGASVTSSSGQQLASLCDSDLHLSKLIESIDGDGEFMERGGLQRCADLADSFPAVGLYQGCNKGHQNGGYQGEGYQKCGYQGEGYQGKGYNCRSPQGSQKVSLRVRVTRGDTQQVAFVLTVQPQDEVAAAPATAASVFHSLPGQFHRLDQLPGQNHRLDQNYGYAACGRAERDWRRGGVAGGKEEEGDGSVDDGGRCQLVMSDEDGTLTIVA